ncbi:hypothetical protein ElyMa_002480900 [Elysia marginata]|uniref:Uncharacterized protein n=1 Tax=Elysia marginata TaxID=1093978 RepID=A0AAV4GNY9_9GAST|nr:hypothetical protein ElyMa_002480900 [Elysia marginata]
MNSLQIYMELEKQEIHSTIGQDYLERPGPQRRLSICRGVSKTTPTWTHGHHCPVTAASDVFSSSGRLLLVLSLREVGKFLITRLDSYRDKPSTIM